MSKEELIEKLKTQVLPNLGKRPKIVLEQILKNGKVSTEELRQLGYTHPPRAASDLKEAGVRIKTKYTIHPDNKHKMGYYVLDENQKVDFHKGRSAFPKQFKEEMFNKYGLKCNITGLSLPKNALQIDHRVPIITESEADELNTNDFQLLSASAQRSKSFSCERCEISTKGKCKSCYWAYPEKYTHIAGENLRIVTLAFDKDKMDAYNFLVQTARTANLTKEEFAFDLISKAQKKKGA